MSVLRSVQLRMSEGWQKRSEAMPARSDKPGLWRRTLASLVDRMLPLPFLVWLFPKWFVVVALYHCLAEVTAERRGFGKALCRLRVVCARTGEKCAGWQAVLRRIGMAASQTAWCLVWLHAEWLPCVLAYELLSLVCVATDPLGRRLEDFVAGTRVVTERAYRREKRQQESI
ncbi:MAG: RDD family protein [Acidobacteriota bacterium]